MDLRDPALVEAWTVVQRFAKHLWLVIAAPLVVGVGVGVIVARLTGVDVTHSQPRTDVRLYQPGLLLSGALKVAARGPGTCGPVSEIDPAPLVVSCFSAKRVSYLTCFGAYTPDVLCVDSPWATRAFALHVTLYYFSVGKGRNAVGVAWNPSGAKLAPKGSEYWAPATKSSTETKPPWAVELSNGQRCVRQWGRPGQGRMDVRGLPVPYECNAAGDVPADINSLLIPKGPIGFIVGEIDRSTEPWTVDFAASGTSSTTQVTVTTAWY